MHCKRCKVLTSSNTGLCPLCSNSPDRQMIQNKIKYQNEQFNTLKEMHKLPVYKENKKNNGLLAFLIIIGVIIVIIVLVFINK